MPGLATEPLLLNSRQSHRRLPTSSNVSDRLGPRPTKIKFGKHKGNVLRSLAMPYLRCVGAKLPGSGEEVLGELVTTNASRPLMLDGHRQRNEHCCSESLNSEILGQLGPETDHATYASLLRRCTNAKALSEGKRVHEHMKRRGYAGKRFLSNLLIEMYSKCGSLDNARAVFDKIVYRNLYSWNIMIAASAQNGCLEDARSLFAEMPQRDVVSWNAMITAYAHNGHGMEALQLFGQMIAEGFEPGKITFICVMDACANLVALEEGRLTHTTVASIKGESDPVVGTALVNMYGKCGSLDDARAVFEEVPQRDVVSWSAMISACAQNGHGKEALQLFSQMQAEGFEPNKITFICIVDACISVAALEEGRMIHAIAVANGWESDVTVGNALLTMYGKCESVDDAKALFAEMLHRNIVSWNAMISMSAQNGSLDGAKAIFAEMPQRDMISWSTMIAACAKNGHSKEALQLFAQMHAEGFELDNITFICVMDACASVAALEEGQMIHATLAGNGWKSNVIVENALVNMYGKCGSLDDAREVFEGMPQRHVVSWSAVIGVCAENGHDKEALQLFGQMQAEGFKPDKITLISVLTACSHTGLVADGRQYFASMAREHGITPSVEHYVCMVDLLGRRGLLEEAENLIIKMPSEHVPSAWLSLLSSCRIYHDEERALRAAKFVFELDPKNASPYVLLANFDGNAATSDHLLKLRKAMTDNGVTKVAGCSCIEVKNVVHEFVAGDTLHPQQEDILAELQRLKTCMEEAGCMTIRNAVLHDVDEEEREEMIYYHSEKMAIAFGLISTPPRTLIRVTKNLRVCDDCHSVAKFISKFAHRKIIMRDASISHHIEYGACSCGDYW